MEPTAVVSWYLGPCLFELCVMLAWALVTEQGEYPPEWYEEIG